jgi:hypothetical protein
MKQYFGLVLCFIGVQVGYAVVGFMSGTSWIQEALEKSWDKAYESDRSLIRDLQIEVETLEKERRKGSYTGFHRGRRITIIVVISLTAKDSLLRTTEQFTRLQVPSNTFLPVATFCKLALVIVSNAWVPLFSASGSFR